MNRRLTICLLSWVWAWAGLAAENAPAGHTGLAVGQKAPVFTLKDQNGGEISLQTLIKEGPVALVFYRSADW